jgi:hypothetical protein
MNCGQSNYGKGNQMKTLRKKWAGIAGAFALAGLVLWPSVSHAQAPPTNSPDIWLN